MAALPHDPLEEPVREIFRYLHLLFRHGVPQPPPFDRCHYEPCATWHRYLARLGRQERPHPPEGERGR